MPRILPPPPALKIELTEKEITSIEEMAYHGFSIDEVNEVLGVRLCIGFLINVKHKNSQAYQAYRKGILRSQLELRQRIFIDAKNGSSPAQALAKKILDDAEFKLSDR